MSKSDKPGKQEKKKKDSHCDGQKTENEAHAHPDYRALLPRLRRVEGQISGIQRMISDGRYCVDILIQFQAVASALRAIESAIFEKHVKGCVTDAMASKNSAEMEKKTQELMSLIFKRLE